MHVSVEPQTPSLYALRVSAWGFGFWCPRIERRAVETWLTAAGKTRQVPSGHPTTCWIVSGEAYVAIVDGLPA